MIVVRSLGGLWDGGALKLLLGLVWIVLTAAAAGLLSLPGRRLAPRRSQASEQSRSARGRRV